MSGWDVFTRETSLNAPVAAPVLDELNNNNLTIAEAEIYLDTAILKKRLEQQITIALYIVKITHHAANDKEVAAGIKSAFGWLFNSESLKEDADKNRKEADKIRENGIKIGLSYVALAMIFETAYWFVEQGLVKAAYRKTLNGLKSISEYFVNSKQNTTSANEFDSNATVVAADAILEEEYEEEADQNHATVVTPPNLIPYSESTNERPLTAQYNSIKGSDWYNTLPSAPAHQDLQDNLSLPIAKPADQDNKNSLPNAPSIEITNSSDKKKISY